MIAISVITARRGPGRQQECEARWRHGRGVERALSASGLPREGEAVLETWWPVVMKLSAKLAREGSHKHRDITDVLGAPAFYAHRSHAASNDPRRHLHSDVTGRRIAPERRRMRTKYGAGADQPGGPAFGSCK